MRQSADSSQSTGHSKSVLNEFWLRMATLFGHTWVSQYGASPNGIAGETWSGVLADLTDDQLALGLRECVVLGGEFPPSAPKFRALCFALPSIREVREQIADPDSSLSPFAVLTRSLLDHYNYRQADGRTQDRMLREAYADAKDHVMRGGRLPSAEQPRRLGKL